MKRMRWVFVPAVLLGGLLALGDVSPTAGKPVGRLALGEAAPEITVTTVEGKGTGLAALRGSNSGKMVVLEFGSITDPIFRARVPAVEKLAGKYADKVLFIVVYQHEAHAADGVEPLELNESDGFNISEPTSLSER